MLAIGLAAAAASWWFRYSATHRAARILGSASGHAHPRRAARDLAVGRVHADGGTKPTSPRHLERQGAHASSHRAVGGSQLRLVGRASRPTSNWSSSLVFEESEGAEPRAVVLFSPDFQWVCERLGRRPERITRSRYEPNRRRPQRILRRPVAGCASPSGSTASNSRLDAAGRVPYNPRPRTSGISA